jgi:diguanylate cyclase (GGDEF)-like protein
MQTDFSALFTAKDKLQLRKAGEVIFATGEPGRVMYIVKSGQAQIRLGEMVLDVVDAGGILGEMAMLDDDVRSASAVAVTDCEVVAVDKQRLLEWVREQPEVAIELGKAMVRRLRKMTTMAQYDALTQLPNRTLFQELCGTALMRAERRTTTIGVLFVDLDHFKAINESLGYAAGDGLLIQVANRLTESLHELDALARLGADEFAVMLEDTASNDELAATAQKLLDALSAPFLVDGQEIFISASVGISCYPQDATSAQNLLKNADTAMRLAKTEGRGRFRFFSPELNAAAVATLVMKNHLRQALDRGELFLNYQPRIDILSGKIVGSEALIRWRHAEHGLVSPAKFIPLAEQAGFIERIGEWVLRTACAQQQAWLNSGLPPFQIAVNLSVQQLRQPDLAKRVAAILRETGLDPPLLELEVTESLFMADGAVARKVLADLRAMGISIALDDFGTGYSSLSYLKQFPLDYLKIDQSFMRGIPDNLDDVAIAKTIVTLAKTLGLREIAEGVESEQQLKFLKELGCEQFQGYLFSRPVGAEEFNDLLNRNLLG